jgi:hypothetical protein
MTMRDAFFLGEDNMIWFIYILFVNLAGLATVVFIWKMIFIHKHFHGREDIEGTQHNRQL